MKGLTRRPVSRHARGSSGRVLSQAVRDETDGAVSRPRAAYEKDRVRIPIERTLA